MAVKKATATFIAEVPSGLKDLAKKDARRFKKTMDGIGTVVLRHFFNMKADERAKFYATLPNKVLGRPI